MALLRGTWQEKFLDAADIDVGNTNLIRGLNLSADPVSFDNERIDLTLVGGVVKDVNITLHGNDRLHNKCADGRALRPLHRSEVFFAAFGCSQQVGARLA